MYGNLQVKHTDSSLTEVAFSDFVSQIGAHEDGHFDAEVLANDIRDKLNAAIRQFTKALTEFEEEETFY